MGAGWTQELLVAQTIVLRATKNRERDVGHFLAPLLRLTMLSNRRAAELRGDAGTRHDPVGSRVVGHAEPVFGPVQHVDLVIAMSATCEHDLARRESSTRRAGGHGQHCAQLSTRRYDAEGDVTTITHVRRESVVPTAAITVRDLAFVGRPVDVCVVARGQPNAGRRVTMLVATVLSTSAFGAAGAAIFWVLGALL